MGKGLSTDAATATTTATATDAGKVEMEDFPDSFLCSICLDLLFKPIVLSCGHISCFWCVHKSMSGLGESNCPICRHTYNYFPNICEMLHALLLKLYPVAYRRREEQTLLEEKEMGSFSPQLDNITYGSPDNRECDPCDHVCSSTTVLESNSYSEPCFTKEQECNGNCKQLSISDAQCNACKQLLFRPVFLNCGHGYCESCISCNDGMLRCQVCHSLHPTDFPKVSLELDHFLEEQFSRDYAMRRDGVQLSNIKMENPTSFSAIASKKGFSVVHSKLNGELSRSKIHIGVGCDFCGMYPVTGDRYRCKDCVEEIGFDLCEDCYNTRSKRPGRFNQKHTPEHKFERINSNNIRRIIWGLLNEQFEDVSDALATSDDISDVAENGLPASHTSADAEEEIGDTAVAAPDINPESSNDQNETQSTT
ncbi:E3 ubiquitin-protein ligase PRT1 [Mercurialis annua]|uniref:E3 ubiquitin-protein ligase PRT1 n=1 Tax=Mercurialis annua TaxID=3986 RepID=UPI002160AE44|nr:E3 ubiquitin-protein ligase PRT1 [Mercurialis annua]